MMLVIDMSTREVDYAPEVPESSYTEEVLDAGWNPAVERLEPVVREDRWARTATTQPPPAALQGDLGLFFEDDADA